MAAKPVGSYQILNQFWGLATEEGEELWINKGGLNGFELLYTAAQIDEIAALKASIGYVDELISDTIEYVNQGDAINANAIIAETNARIAEANTKANAVDIIDPVRITFSDLVSNTYTNLIFANQTGTIEYYDENGLQKKDITFNPSGTVTMPITAPANFVGWIDGVSGALGNFVSKSQIGIVTGKNLANPVNIVLDRYINTVNGNIETLAGWKIIAIDVSPSTTYTISGWATAPSVRAIRYENSSGGLISFIGSSLTNPQTITTPALCTKMLFTIKRQVEPDTIYQTLQVEIGSSATAYEAYKSYVDKILGVLIRNADKDVYDKSETYSRSETVALIPTVQYVTIASRNIINPDNILIDKYITIPAGTIGTLAGWKAVSVIVTPNTQYTISGWMVATSSALIRCENIAGGLISTIAKTGNTQTITTPALCTKIIFTIKRAVEADTVYQFLQMELGAVATPYEAFFSETYVEKINNYPLLPSGGATIVENSLTLLNSNKILFFGCSYTENYYAIKNKSWVNKLANFIDYTCFNFGRSSDTLLKELSRFRNNTVSFGNTPQSLDGTLIWIGNIGNETMFDYDSDLYIRQFREFIDFARYNGAQLILSTDHTVLNHNWLETVIKDIADEYGCYFFPSGVVGDQTLRVGFGGFWKSNHPGTRSDAYQFLTQLNYLLQIQQPKKSIKIFRKRSAYTPIVIDDLNFDTNVNRNKKWIEINSGETHINEADNSYLNMDNLQNGTLTYVAQNNEYGALLLGSPVSFADYALLSFIVDKIRPSKITISIKMSDVGTFYVKNGKKSTYWEPSDTNNVVFNVSEAVYNSVTIAVGAVYTTPSVTTQPNLTYTGKFYDYRIGYCLCFSNIAGAVKNSNAGGTLTKSSGTGDASIAYTKFDVNLNYHYLFFKELNMPQGGFDAITPTYVDGYKVIEITEEMQKYMQYDRIDILVNHSSSFNISGVDAVIEGGEDKIIVPKNLSLQKTGTELISNNIINSSATGWLLDNGSVVDTIPSNYEDYPSISGGSSSKHVNLVLNANDTPSKMSTSISIASVNGYRKLIVKICNRLFPKVYTPSGSNTAYTTTTREITPDSYDFGTIMLQIKPTGGSPITMRKTTDIGWNFTYFEVTIPPFTTSAELSICRDPADIVNRTTYKNQDWPLQVCYISAQIF